VDNDYASADKHRTEPQFEFVNSGRFAIEKVARNYKNSGRCWFLLLLKGRSKCKHMHDINMQDSLYKAENASKKETFMS